LWWNNNLNNQNIILPQTAMRRVTIPIDLLLEATDPRDPRRVIGTVQCSVASPCWQQKFSLPSMF
jgi:hypothetical protein